MSTGDGLRTMTGEPSYAELESENKNLRQLNGLKLISVRNLEGDEGLISELRKVVFDANVHIIYGDYIYGERCYKKALAILKKLGIDYQAETKPEPVPNQLELKL